MTPNTYHVAHTFSCTCHGAHQVSYRPLVDGEMEDQSQTSSEVLLGLEPRTPPGLAWAPARKQACLCPPCCSGQGAPDCCPYQLGLLPLVPVLFCQQVADDLHKVLERKG